MPNSPDFLAASRRQNRQQLRREVTKDLLVILVLAKFSLEYMFRQGGLAPAFGIALLISGVIAIVVRIDFFSNLLSIAAIILFLIDIYSEGGPNSLVLFVFLAIIAIILSILLRLFSR